MSIIQEVKHVVFLAFAITLPGLAVRTETNRDGSPYNCYLSATTTPLQPVFYGSQLTLQLRQFGKIALSS